MYTILLVIHTIIVVFLILLVLIQRTDGDGLGGLGGGGNQFLTGRSQANILTRTTAILAGAFFLTSLILAVMANRMGDGSIIDSMPAMEESAPASAPVEKEAPAPVKTKKETPAVPKPE